MTAKPISIAATGALLRGGDPQCARGNAACPAECSIFAFGRLDRDRGDVS